MSVRVHFSAPKKAEDTTMSYVKVKTAEGRIAYDAPRGGKKIPNDKFVQVRETTYIRRLIDFHGDLIEEGGKSAKKKAAEHKPDAPVAKPITPAT